MGGTCLNSFLLRPTLRVGSLLELQEAENASNRSEVVGIKLLSKKKKSIVEEQNLHNAIAVEQYLACNCMHY